MKKIFLFVLFLLLLSACRSDDEKAALALARRVMGPQAGGIVFERISASEDCYELRQKGNKVLIRGNNANSMAVGLNRYIQEYCLADVSWYHYNPVELPPVLPSVPEPVTGKAEMPIRFFLNYCTLGYTMPWWQWEEWERFIDWMALNGVNMPLAITGEEAVWQKVWRKYGLTDEQIRAFFTGPAHLPWQRMCNVDRWQGPLPQSWIDGQAELQKRILKRERELNMKPVLPAFSGHIPRELAGVVDQHLDTSQVARWGNFAHDRRCTFLNPTDPMFSRIQKDFLEEHTRMYGTSHIYGLDSFNEVAPPSWEPDTLAILSKGIYESLTAVDPDAVWLQMGWLFLSKSWTPERIKAYLGAVPLGRLILLDYESDYLEIWRRTERFYGHNFIWCYLGNFGGMTCIEGDYHLNAERIAATRTEGGPGFVGIGSTLEGFGVNEPIYQALLDQAWSDRRPVEDYIDNIADRRLGRQDSTYRAYWHKIVDQVSITHTSTSSSDIVCAHPNLEGIWNWTTEIKRAYNPVDLEDALAMLETVDGDSDAFRFDLANARRQVLVDRAQPVRDRFTTAYYTGDREGMTAARDHFLSICDSLVAVLKTRPEFSLEKWISAARAWGRTPQEKDYFERNARTIITVWGDSYYLSDYANRDWDGLVETFYKPRWEMFFSAVLDAFDAGEPFVNMQSPRKRSPEQEACLRGMALDEAIWDFECRWTGISETESSDLGTN